PLGLDAAPGREPTARRRAGQPPPVRRLLLPAQLRRAHRMPAVMRRPRQPGAICTGHIGRAPTAQVPPHRLRCRAHPRIAFPRERVPRALGAPHEGGTRVSASTRRRLACEADRAEMVTMPTPDEADANELSEAKLDRWGVIGGSGALPPMS